MIKFSFHEDDLHQTVIYSFDKLEELRIQADNSKDFSRYGKFDFSKIDYNSDKTNSIESLQISVFEFENFLKNYKLKKILNVYTGYSRKLNNKLKDTTAFCENKNCAIIYKHEKGFLKNLWVYNIEFFDKNVLGSLLLKLGEIWNFLLFDQNDYLVELKNLNQIRSYLKTL